jgi:hypothetical protein
MKTKIGKTLKQHCHNAANTIIPVILLTIILCGQNYAQWEKTSFPDTVKVNTLVTKDSSIFAGTDGYGIFVSTNNGENWKSINEGLQSKIVHTIFINGKTLPAGQARIFAGTETGVSVSTDNGENWRSINSGLFGLGVWSLVATADTVGDTTIFAGTWSGVYSSTDWGENWKITGLSSTTMPVHSIIIFDRYMYAATFSGGLFLSLDKGRTWKNIDINPKGTTGYDPISVSAPIYSISLFAGPEKNYILVGSIGVLFYASLGDTLFYADTSFAKVYKQGSPIHCLANSDDTLFTALGGYLFKLSWVHIIWHNIPLVEYTAERLFNVHILGSPIVYSLTMNNGYIVAGTEDGIWRLRYPEAVTRVTSSQNIPAGFVLEQNYPNPFNPTTFITYRLPGVSNVTLMVFDVLGRPVATLVNERQSAGSYSVKFDADILPSGAYFYSIAANGSRITRKLILMR